MRKLLLFIDVFLFPILSLVFIFGMIQGSLSVGKGVVLTGAYLLMVGALFLAKFYRKRITSFIAYVVSLISILILLNAFYGNVEDVSAVDMLVILIGGLIACIFKFNGYVFTGFLGAFWYAVYDGAGNSGSLSEFLSLYMKPTELYNYMEPKTILIGFLIGIVLSALSIIFRASYYIYTERSRNFVHSMDDNYSNGELQPSTNFKQSNSDNNYQPSSIGGFVNYGDENNQNNNSSSSGSFESSPSSSEKTSTWGQRQIQIDAQKDIEDFGKPDWVAKKERDEEDYGLPSYARKDE